MAFDAFLKLDGVSGESTRQGHEGEIQLRSFSFGAHNPSSIGIGGGGGAGKASLSPFHFQKMTDQASPVIFQACCSGKHFPTATVTLRKSGGESVDYLVYKFSGVYIESIEWSGSPAGDDVPMESLSMAYGRVEVIYTPQTDTGAKGSPIVGSWDQLKVSP